MHKNSFTSTLSAIRQLLIALALLAPALSQASGELLVAEYNHCPLENGEQILDCRVAYRTFGTLNAARSNVVLVPSWYGGTASDLVNFGYVGPGKIVDTDHYYVIAVNHFSNGVSSSPSNYGAASGQAFPDVSIRDSVRAQQRLLTDTLALNHIHAVVGFSMGGMQTLEWMMQYPGFATHYVAVEATPWPTFHDYLLWNSWMVALNLPRETKAERANTNTLLAGFDALSSWTPGYINREIAGKNHRESFSALIEDQSNDALDDRASQTWALLNYDTRLGFEDFDRHLKTIKNQSVLAINFASDLKVNPAPTRELAKKMGFKLLEIEGDCGHMGPNEECYQASVAESVQAFLATPAATALQAQRRTMTHDSIEREYFVYAPATGTNEGPMPVVFALHGYGTTATGFAASYALSEHAQKHRYILVIPQGSHFLASLGTDPNAEPFFISTWNDLASNFTPSVAGPHCTDDRLQYPCPPECGSCNHCAWVSCYDDLGFLERVLDAVESEFTTDPLRYYLLGNSNGAILTQTIGCDKFGERFAASAALLAQMPPGFECAPKHSQPLLLLAGELDDTMGIDGTPTSDGWIYASVESTRETWAKGMGCEEGPQPWRSEITQANGLQCVAYSQCDVEGHQVVSCIDPEAGHEWRGQRLTNIPSNCVSPEQQAALPGQALCETGEDSSGLWGMDLVWQFLGQYRRQ
jgi:homoserine O-acetyltransferase